MTINKISGIYQIKNNKTNKVYIGSSVDIKNRWRQHKQSLRKDEHHSRHLQRSWNKHGEDAFEFSVLEKGIEKEDLKFQEQLWMDNKKCYYPDFGYNASKVASYPLPRDLTPKDLLYRSSNMGGGYLITFPTGLELHCTNLNEFAKVWDREYKINSIGLGKVARGERSSHKGFKVKRAIKEFRSPEFVPEIESRPITHVIYDPEGKRYETNHLYDFCRRHKISPTGLKSCAERKAKQCKSWQCFYPENDPGKQIKENLKTLYTIRDPEGNIYKTRHLMDFCNEKGLDGSCMGQSAKRENSFHRGWSIEIGDKMPISQKEPVYLVIDSKGKEYKVPCLTEFCLENNIKPESKNFSQYLSNAAYGYRNPPKGWWCEMLKEEKLRQYKMTDPKGKNYIVNNLTKFCRESGLFSKNRSVIVQAYEYSKGKRTKPFSDGWTCTLLE